MNKQIIFIADDLGLNSEINKAILYAHFSGNLHGAALMMAQPGTEEAVVLARENPKLQIGLHFHLNDSHPATRENWPWGTSPARAGLSMALSRKSKAIMRGEISRQWELFQETGLPCRFVNTHHHLHAHPAVYEAIVETIGSDFTGWIRLGQVRYFQDTLGLDSSFLVSTLFQRARKLSTWRSPDTLWGLDRPFSMKAREVRSVIEKLPDGFHEFLFHPRTQSCPDTQCLLELAQEPVP